MMMQPMTTERENYRLTARMLCRQGPTVEEPWLFVSPDVVIVALARCVFFRFA